MATQEFTTCSFERLETWRIPVVQVWLGDGLFVNAIVELSSPVSWIRHSLFWCELFKHKAQLSRLIPLATSSDREQGIEMVMPIDVWIGGLLARQVDFMERNPTDTAYMDVSCGLGIEFFEQFAEVTFDMARSELRLVPLTPDQCLPPIEFPET